MEKLPDTITLCNLEVVLMPNGEIICLGKTIGRFKNLGKYLTIKVKDV